MAQRIQFLAKIGKENVTKWSRISLFLLAIILASGAWLTNARLTTVANLNAHQVLLAEDQNTISYQINRSINLAVRGEADVFERLRNKRAQFQENLANLNKGVAAAGGPEMSRYRALLKPISQMWLDQNKFLIKILNSQKTLLALHEKINTIEDILPRTRDTMEIVIKRIGDVDFPTAATLEAGRQLTRLALIRDALHRIWDGGTNTAEASAALTTNITQFAEALKTLSTQSRSRGANANEIRAGLDDITNLIKPTRSDIEEISILLNTVQPIIEQGTAITNNELELSDALSALAKAYRDTEVKFYISRVSIDSGMIFFFATLALLSLASLALLALRDARLREETSKTQSERDERAILRLLDEMGDLADGDLTVQATVTEDKTGAIADSINYAIEALRGLVTTINETALRVTRSAQENRAISLRLAEASSVQSLQITQASSAVQSLTVQIDEVARNASESAEVALRSVDVAGRGAQTVRDTIQGMDDIREQIRETAKRIKRLGESSQEIGEIVELIDDIADQTNILALNAAMQAAMAGEAGRGFAVVADEVQRLAERSRNATKQIEVLVRTIQADTNEAVSSMETTTEGVVTGAKRAENAGAALTEIEEVSRYIADLIKRIADSSQRQSRQSAEINDMVQAIRAITEENTEGTRRAADAVEELANLAVEMQRSVAGFRLP